MSGVSEDTKAQLVGKYLTSGRIHRTQKGQLTVREGYEPPPPAHCSAVVTPSVRVSVSVVRWEGKVSGWGWSCGVEGAKRPSP
jgi:hypothetical protein